MDYSQCFSRFASFETCALLASHPREVNVKNLTLLMPVKAARALKVYFFTVAIADIKYLVISGITFSNCDHILSLLPNCETLLLLG